MFVGSRDNDPLKYAPDHDGRFLSTSRNYNSTSLNITVVGKQNYNCQKYVKSCLVLWCGTQSFADSKHSFHLVHLSVINSNPTK